MLISITYCKNIQIPLIYDGPKPVSEFNIQLKHEIMNDKEIGLGEYEDLGVLQKLKDHFNQGLRLY